MTEEQLNQEQNQRSLAEGESNYSASNIQVLEGLEAVRKLRAMTNKDEAVALYPKVQKMLDKLAKTNIIHKNKAANLKSSLAKHINKLG